MGKLRPFVQKESYMPNKKWIPFVIGNGYTTVDGASGPAPEWDTAIGNPVSFNALTSWPLKQLSVAFSPVQSLNGYDSPWPAGGGANILPDISRTGTSGTMTAVFGKDSVVLTGTADGDGGRNYLRSELFSLKAGTYYFKLWNVDVHSKAQPSVFLQNGASLVSVDSGTRAFTLAEDSSSMNIGLNCAKDSEYNYSAQFTISKTDISAYSPYSNICPISGWDELTVYHSGADTSDPQTISISIGQTVYSGTVDVLTGVLTVDKAEVDGGSLSWTKISGNNYRNFAAQLPSMPKYGVSLKAVISSQYASESNNSAPAGRDNYCWIRSDLTLSVKDLSKDGMTKEQFKESMAGVQFCYELATPQTIQLTPQEVSSLLGENNMWSDANGDLTVEYRSN